MLLVSFNINPTGVTCGAGTADLSGAHDFTPSFSGVRAVRSVAFCVDAKGVIRSRKLKDKEYNG